jgi:hypothetical protein
MLIISKRIEYTFFIKRWNKLGTLIKNTQYFQIFIDVTNFYYILRFVTEQKHTI